MSEKAKEVKMISYCVECDSERIGRRVKKDQEKLIVGDDLEKYVSDNIEDIVESHIEAWKERYWRQSLRRIKFDLEHTYDDSLDIESAEINLKRKLTDDERKYLLKEFIKEIGVSFYKD